ncbi:MAG: [acyl-carrier-protein] S-malonyltransferase [Lentisphaerae bacterium RIFOXYB12_FULL_65_16]|nr:MAG: [acyl-carrier-protein] S-malonyltransferase [Lentisphaerae bacterium RIFOXYA12_64_32]OGV85396.1 MAG: [acyl-carrier-protein] S-malonyltransferase [Lentisphaerae bacterium RIFOXYB12_FULL_65_16]
MSKRVGFMFAGQGAQSVGMGKDLAETFPSARAVFDEADRVLQRDVSGLCFTGPLEKLTLSANCQPAIYTMSLACLAALKSACPIEPSACAGLSLGEYAALTAADALDFAAGIRLVAARGALMHDACRSSSGAMAAILKADPQKVEATCAAHGVDVANYNCPGQIVISGTREAVAACAEALKAGGDVKVIMLQVDGAFHSRLMQPAADRFGAALAQAPLRQPRCPVAQNVTGSLVDDPEAIRVNLGRQITGSVRWEACVRAMQDRGLDALIELGPGQVLSKFMKQISRDFPCYNVATAADVAKVAAALA